MPVCLRLTALVSVREVEGGRARAKTTMKCSVRQRRKVVAKRQCYHLSGERQKKDIVALDDHRYQEGIVQADRLNQVGRSRCFSGIESKLANKTILLTTSRTMSSWTLSHLQECAKMKT